MKERSGNITADTAADDSRNMAGSFLRKLRSGIPAAVALALIIFLWWALCASGAVPSYMLPSPVDVVRAFADDFPNLMYHAKTSLQEAAYGLLIGIALAFVIATVMDHFLWLDRALSPILVITQTIPTIAIAPLLVLWMGFGMAPKITLVVITTFFPIAVGLLGGYRSVDPDEINLMRAMGAGRRQIFRYVKLPAALGHFFSGLRISASYAVVGAVISEWLGGFEGLGVYMTRVKKAYAFDRMFAVIILIVVISLILMGLVDLIRTFSMPWTKVRETSAQPGGRTAG